MVLNVVVFILALSFQATVHVVSEGIDDVPFNRSSFPADFVFGAASSAYQYEGAYNEGGRGLTIWDTLAHSHPERIADRSNADLAVDSYHRYSEDTSLLKDMGMDAYRFSIAWSRILPMGTLRGGINKEGIQFYNNLINDIIAKGLKPFATIYHWDLPQALETKYLGLLSPRFVNDYRDFADVCFKEFGDRVKHWVTFNEPWSFCSYGYSLGAFAPARCSKGKGNCTAGNSATEPYLCAHHVILGHATAAKLYREKYKPIQNGKIGITLVTHWFHPYSNTKADEDAVIRALDAMFGWFMDPLTQGDYPFTVRAIVGNRLPRFSAKETALIKGSLDFVGINYYTTYYARSISLLTRQNVISYESDSYTYQSGFRNGIPIGRQAFSKEMFTYPEGLKELMLYVKDKYNSPEVYITETGTSEGGNSSIPLEQALVDSHRIEFYRGHLSSLLESIREGANVKGFFPWTLLDCWEWTAGYTARFGIVYVDRQNGIQRRPKASYKWFQTFLKV